jgi:hypothetical protein
MDAELRCTKFPLKLLCPELLILQGLTSAETLERKMSNAFTYEIYLS